MAQRGFTAIELLVAMAILAILAAIAWPSYSTWQQREGLTEGAMFVKSALSTARSRSIQNGLSCGCAPGVACTASKTTGGCTSRSFGVQIDETASPNRIELVRLCDENGDICEGNTATTAIDAGELSTIWTRDLHSRVSVNTTDTPATVLDNGIFFGKSGRPSGQQGTVFLTADGKERCVAVSKTGRIREGVPDGSGGCD